MSVRRLFRREIDTTPIVRLGTFPSSPVRKQNWALLSTASATEPHMRSGGECPVLAAGIKTALCTFLCTTVCSGHCIAPLLGDGEYIPLLGKF